MKKLGHSITKQTGELIAKDLRVRRFGSYVHQRAEMPRGGDGVRCRHFRAPGGGIAAFNGTSKQMGSASCREWIPTPSGLLVDTSLDYTIYNPFGAIAGNAWILVIEDDQGLLVNITPPTTSFDVRVKPDGTALQKSTDGGVTWTDWATIGSC